MVISTYFRTRPWFFVLSLLFWTTGAHAADPEFSTVFEKSGAYGYRIPSVVVSRAGTVLAFAERRVGLHDHAQNDIVVRRSTDGGRSWGQEIFVHEDGSNVLVNPCAVVLDSGRILVMYQWFKAGYHARAGKHMKLLDPGLEGDTVSHTLVTHSDDDGLTWSTPRDVTRQTKRPHVTSTATGPGIGIVLRRGPHPGRILMPTNESWFEGKDRFFNIYACYSDDGGETWSLGDVAPSGDTGQGNECQVVELADGRVLFNSRGFDGAKRRKVAVSADGGATWSALRNDPVLVEPRCMASVLRYGPADAERKRILYAGPGSETRRAVGTIRVSYDEGKTWPVSRVFEPEGYAYSCLTELPDGTIGCLYEGAGYHTIRFARLPLAWVEPGR
jgi:sialidase-1